MNYFLFDKLGLFYSIIMGRKPHCEKALKNNEIIETKMKAEWN